MNHGFLVERFKELSRAFWVGIADKDLAKSVVVDHANEALNALRIELVKDVVEQQDGLSTKCLVKHFKRGELEGNQETLLLSLLTYALQRMTVQREVEVFAVRTRRGKLQHSVF